MYEGSVMDELRTFQEGRLPRRLYDEKVAKSIEASRQYSEDFNHHQGRERRARQASWVTPGVALIATLDAIKSMEEYPCEIVPVNIKLFSQILSTHRCTF